MSNNSYPTHKVTIAVSHDAAKIEVAPVNPEHTAYIEKFLTRKGCACAKTYVYPEVHEIIKRLVLRCGVPQATIGGYMSEIILDHIEKHRDIMQGIFDDNRQKLF